MNALKIILPIYFVLFLLGGFRNIKMFLLLTGIVTMPFRTTYTIMDVGPYTGWTNGINISLSDVSFICLFFYLLLKGRSFSGYSKKIIAAMALVVGSVVLSLVNSTWMRLSLFEAILLVQVFFLYYIVLTSAIDSEKELRFVIMALIISLFVQGSFGVLQYLTGRELDVFVTGTPVTDVTEEGAVYRALGTIGKPNGLAMYLVPLILLVTALLIKEGEKPYRKLGALAAAVGGVALLFSFSRGGWMAFGLAFLVLIFTMAKGGRTKAGASFAVFAAVMLLGIAFYPQIHDRLASQEGTDAAVDRIYLIKIAWNMIKESPVVGIGANTFMSVISHYQRGLELQDIYLHMVHNQYLLVFAETGLVGVAAFLWLLVTCFRESLKCARNGTSELARTIGLSAGAGFTAMAIHMMVDMYSSPLCLGLLFVFAGLCTAAMKIQPAEATASVGAPARQAAKRHLSGLAATR
jgi:hypothetical protein